MKTLKVIDRNIINKNIKFYDINPQGNISNYDYSQFISIVDKIKFYLTTNYNITSGETVLIGYENTCVYKFASFFACLELGLSITIIDYNPGGLPGRPINIEKNTNKSAIYHVDTKTELLSPIHYFICKKSEKNEPGYLVNYFANHCLNTIYHENLVECDPVLLTSYKSEINKKSISMKCTSSGTTGTPKVIEHSHEVLYNICQRNSKMFYGSCANEKSLGHGSSPSTYFIPILISKKVKSIINIDFELDDFVRLKKLKNEIIFDHIMIPYVYSIQDYLNNIEFTNLHSNTTIYTLSTIKDEWASLTKKNVVKNIISFFGTSETCGPIFINESNDPNFVHNKFKLIDEYYKISFTDENLLEVIIPVINKKVCTNDEFIINSEYFYHKGRKDLIRINDFEVDTKKFDMILYKLSSILDGKFIYDTTSNEIYLAIWNDVPNLDALIKKINNKILHFSWNCHFISKYKILNYKLFFTGVKIDIQLLKDYFRTNVEKSYD